MVDVQMSRKKIRKNTFSKIFLQCEYEIIFFNGAQYADINLFKFNDRNTRKRCEICSKLIIKTPERRH